MIINNNFVGGENTAYSRDIQADIENISTITYFSFID